VQVKGGVAVKEYFNVDEKITEESKNLLVDGTGHIGDNSSTQWAEA
jgi:hypothetical protein